MTVIITRQMEGESITVSVPPEDMVRTGMDLLNHAVKLHKIEGGTKDTELWDWIAEVYQSYENKSYMKEE